MFASFQYSTNIRHHSRNGIQSFCNSNLWHLGKMTRFCHCMFTKHFSLYFPNLKIHFQQNRRKWKRPIICHRQLIHRKCHRVGHQFEFAAEFHFLFLWWSWSWFGKSSSGGIKTMASWNLVIWWFVSTAKWPRSHLPRHVCPIRVSLHEFLDRQI